MNAPSAPPRPDTLRETVSLDGAWEFRHETDGAWREARVPSPWQACFPDLAVSYGRATYRRRIAIPAEWRDREVAIRFGAVSDIATIRLGDREIGRHEGGYLPFEVVVPPDLVGAESALEVEAVLPDARREGELPDFAEIAHGKQSWYGPQGGIWQSVHLEARSAAHIAALRLDPLWPEGRLDIRVGLSRPARGTLALEIADPSGAVVQRGTLEVAGAEAEASLTLLDVQPWSPETPALYSLRATLHEGGEARDIRAEAFGFRRIEAKDGYLHLNGAPLYLRGALDQDYYPDGFGTPPSTEILVDQIRQAKAMGLNCLRLHIKVPDPRYYEAADREGILIWTEIPNIETWTPASAARLRTVMDGILARDRNHPSIVIWTLINEDWGTRLREVAEQRRWLSGMVDWLRAEDPLRLVVDNSACFPNAHVKTDINDYHFYRTAVDRREEWEALCREFAGRADWTFSADPEAEQTGTEPLILSEFGVWGLPDPALLKDADGRDPWWAPYGATWADGTALPQGIEARFAELGLEQVFGSLGGFIEQVQWHQFENLKWEIETLRAHASVGGYVITEFTDVHWEGNGLLDMARNPRAFVPALPRVNADLVIAPGLAHPAARAGHEVALDLKVATGGARLPEGARLAWRWGEASGEVPLPATGPMSAAEAPLRLAAPEVAAAEASRLALVVLAPDGTRLAESDQAVALYPRRDAPPRPVAFSTTERDLASRLVQLGHREVEPDEAEIFVVDTLDAPHVEAIHAGARVLQIVHAGQRWLRHDTPPRDGPMTMPIEDATGGTRSAAYFSFPGYGLKRRHRTIWRGDWVGNFAWLRRDGAFAHLPGRALLDLSFARVIPHEVLSGMRPWEFRGRVHAGLVVGWVHKPAAFVIEKRLGRGALVTSTFRLNRDPFDHDPVATALWDGLVELAAGRGVGGATPPGRP